jgi:hypothetical protein
MLAEMTIIINLGKKFDVKDAGEVQFPPDMR